MLCILLILVLLLSISFDIVEGFEGYRGMRKGGGRRGRGDRKKSVERKGGNRYPRKMKVHRRHRHDRHDRHDRSRHRWLRGPRTRLYDSDHYYWGGWRPWSLPHIYDYYPSWLYSARCRSGCGYLGNGVVGCVNPTNSPDSCIFASDCYGC